LLSKKARTTAGFFGPAHIPHRKIHADSRPEPVIPAPCRAGQIAGGRLAARCKRGLLAGRFVRPGNCPGAALETECVHQQVRWSAAGVRRGSSWP
jgi:hypothetical protein